MTHLQILDLTDTENEHLASLLTRYAEILDPVRAAAEIAPSWGYGSALHIGGAENSVEIMMAPYCWCEHDECPHCVPHLGVGAGHSAHQAVRLTPHWKRVHHVDGEGAPNFYFRDDEGEVFVWWYKYIGRGMRCAATGDALNSTKLEARLAKAVQASARDILQDSLSRILLRPDPQAGELAVAARAMIADGLAAMVAACAEEDLSDLGIRLGKTVSQLYRERYMASQSEIIEGLLDKAGVQKSANPDDPDELRFPYTASHRVETVLFRGGVFTDPFEDLDDEVPFDPATGDEESVPF